MFTFCDAFPTYSPTNPAHAHVGDSPALVRLYRGMCPVHGANLQQGSPVWRDGRPVADELRCARSDCKFRVEVAPNTALWRSIREYHDVLRIMDA